MPRLLSTEINLDLGEIDNELRDLIDYLSLGFRGFPMRDDDGMEVKCDTQEAVEMILPWTKHLQDRCALLHKISTDALAKWREQQTQT